VRSGQRIFDVNVPFDSSTADCGALAARWRPCSRADCTPNDRRVLSAGAWRFRSAQVRGSGVASLGITPKLTTTRGRAQRRQCRRSVARGLAPPDLVSPQALPGACSALRCPWRASVLTAPSAQIVQDANVRVCNVWQITVRGERRARSATPRSDWVGRSSTAASASAGASACMWPRPYVPAASLAHRARPVRRTVSTQRNLCPEERAATWYSRGVNGIGLMCVFLALAAGEKSRAWVAAAACARRFSTSAGRATTASARAHAHAHVCLHRRHAHPLHALNSHFDQHLPGTAPHLLRARHG
jgi:hypothetical protein